MTFFLLARVLLNTAAHRGSSQAGDVFDFCCPVCQLEGLSCCSVAELVVTNLIGQLWVWWTEGSSKHLPNVCFFLMVPLFPGVFYGLVTRWICEMNPTWNLSTWRARLLIFWLIQTLCIYSNFSLDFPQNYITVYSALLYKREKDGKIRYLPSCS